MNIYTSSIFLNAASCRGEKYEDGITLFSKLAHPIIESISCDGEIQVMTMQGGNPHTDTYTDLEDSVLLIDCDINTPIRIVGNVTSLTIGENSAYTKAAFKNTALTQLNCSNCDALTTLDVSKNTALTQLNCSYCYALTTLDVSKNTALTQLNCSNCHRVKSILTTAENSTVANAVVRLMADNGAIGTIGIVYADSGETYYSQIEQGAEDAGWSIEELPEA